MHKIKAKKQQTKKENISNEITIKRFAIIFTFILVFFLAFYLLTTAILNNRKEKKQSYSNATLVEDYNEILISDMLKQEGDTYYVFVNMEKSNDIYDLYLSKRKDVYYVNINNALNKTVVSKDLNIDSDPRNIRLNDTTLFVINNGEISNYYVGHNDVMNALKEI